MISRWQWRRLNGLSLGVGIVLHSTGTRVLPGDHFSQHNLRRSPHDSFSLRARKTQRIIGGRNEPMAHRFLRLERTCY